MKSGPSTDGLFEYLEKNIDRAVGAYFGARSWLPKSGKHLVLSAAECDRFDALTHSVVKKTLKDLEKTFSRLGKECSKLEKRSRK